MSTQCRLKALDWTHANKTQLTTIIKFAIAQGFKDNTGNGLVKMKNGQQSYIYSTSLPFMLWTCYNPDVADHESRVVDGKSHYLHVVGAH